MLGKTTTSRKKLTGSFQQRLPKETTMPPANERRQCLRYLSQSSTTYQPTVEDDAPNLPAKIKDVSHHGICLRVAQPGTVGELMHVAIQATEKEPVNMLVCVMHSEQCPAGDWQVGCSFIRELSDRELKALL